MKTTDFNWGDDIIDSRDIISRYEELNNEYESLFKSIDDAKVEINEFIKEHDISHDYEDDIQEEFNDLKEALEEAKYSLKEFEESDDKEELDLLKKVVEECENCADWYHGELLIHESYFTQYIEDLVNDCYEIPKEFNSNDWPWCHMNMDWDAAAEDAKQDYHEFTVEGETYFIRA